MEQKPKIHPAVAAIIVVVLVGIVASVAIVVANNNANDTQTTQNSSTSSDEATTDASDTSEYKDGTYSATGTYLSPGGQESIGLTVTIKDGVITETSVEKEAGDAEADQYQTLFANNYKSMVVGKPVNGLSLGRVAGSSLTSNGFNTALDEIRSEARA